MRAIHEEEMKALCNQLHNRIRLDEEQRRVSLLRQPTKRRIELVYIQPSQDRVVATIKMIVQRGTSRVLTVGQKDMMIVDAGND